MTPTQRTLAAQRELGREVATVERFLAYAGPHGQRADMFGFADLVYIDPEKGIGAIQSCGTAYSEHVKKLTSDALRPILTKWLKWAPLELWGWRKVLAKPGGKQRIYKARVADASVGPDGAIVFTEREQC